MKKDDLLAALQTIHAEMELQPGDLTIRRAMEANPTWSRGHARTMIQQLAKAKKLKPFTVIDETGHRTTAWRK